MTIKEDTWRVKSLWDYMEREAKVSKYASVGELREWAILVIAAHLYKEMF